MKDDLGDRMKEYEMVTRQKLPRRGYTIIRIDGKAFHTYTKGLQRPFDIELVEDMDATAAFLCREIQNAVCAFVQSDEISILMCDFDKLTTSPWFDNNILKITSVSSSMATAFFNYRRLVTYWSGDWKWNNDIDTGFGVKEHFEEGYDHENDEAMIGLSKIINYFPNGKWKLPMFDSRPFQVPNKLEAENYFIWRQQDTVKNSIPSLAQTLFSHKELHGKNDKEKQEMMFQKSGINWNDYDPKLKRGRMIIKETYEKEPDVIRTRWVSVAPPIFTQDRDFLNELIPNRDDVKYEHKTFIPKNLTEDEKTDFIKSLENELRITKKMFNI